MNTIERSTRWLSGLFLVISILAILWILLPSLVANSTNSNTDSVLDLNMHDSYFVVANAHIFGLMAILAFAFSLFYFGYTRSTGLRLSPALGWLHWVGSAILVLLPAQLVFSSIVLSGAPRRYYSYSEFPMFDGVIDLMTLCLVVGIVAQACFVINVACSPFRERSS